MLRIISIVGARPQFIKAAVLSRLIKNNHSHQIIEILVHTGQHYDYNMSKIFFQEMMIPKPQINLGIGSGRHGKQTGKMLYKIERVLLKHKPDWVLVYGDTNSTLAGALAASKLNIPVAHIEAGLRSYYKRMPEEQNRIITDHLSTICFCPTEKAKENLIKEGLSPTIKIVGDIMYDAYLFYKKLLDDSVSQIKKRLESMFIDKKVPKYFYLLTLHRAENTDDPDRLKNIVEALNSIKNIEGVFPIHPRTAKAIRKNNLKIDEQIHVIKPVSYLEMLLLESRCQYILTDSGGLQKEAYFARKPCISLRDQTEWVETVKTGWNKLVGADKKKIIAATNSITSPENYQSFYGDGHTARNIIQCIL